MTIVVIDIGGFRMWQDQRERPTARLARNVRATPS
jgi:hypothetical protein